MKKKGRKQQDERNKNKKKKRRNSRAMYAVFPIPFCAASVFSSCQGRGFEFDKQV
jgi:hypothetical protein